VAAHEYPIRHDVIASALRAVADCGLVVKGYATGVAGSITLRSVSAHAQAGDAALLEGLRCGDEGAFARLVDCHHRALVRLAQLYVRDRSVAEEVVQETWLAVLEGIDRFEERSSLKTWIYRILTNRAKTRAQRERRQLPFSALSGDSEPEVDQTRFLPIDDPQYPHHWAVPPRSWPDERILARETITQLRDAVAQLPSAQQVIVGLRDVEGWSSDEVCQALEISPGNQRVLLHRARSRLRTALEHYFDGE
jgi:RNA polymerase sigma-70 factor, ECF subfamily